MDALTMKLACAHCGAPMMVEASVCPTCGEDPLLQGRYRLDAVLGQGAMGVTWRATRLEDGEVVAIKELPFRRIDSMKTRTLFEREARVLRELDHRGVPHYVDDFVAGQGKSTSLYLVQEFIDGRTLAEELSARRYDVGEVLAVLDEVLDVLIYLHGLSPPVIHRDIKPSNIVRREDGRLVLIDFGAVRDVIKDRKLGGSTVVGTFGYMAPEQFMGIAEPATDLYALGALAVELLSRRPPDAMMALDGTLQWEEFVQVDGGTAGLLASMLVRDHTARAGDARVLQERVRRLRAGLQRASSAPRAGEVEAVGAPSVATVWPVEPSWFDVERGEPEAEWRMPELVGLLTEPGEVDVRSASLSPDIDMTGSTPRGAGVGDSRPVVLGVGFAVIGLVVLGVMVVVSTARDAPPKMLAARESLPRCGDAPCPPVARGLKGLDFGMTRPEAEARMPELVGLPTEPGEAVDMHSASLLPDLDVADIMERTRLPGVVVAVDTTLGNLPATCRLEFAAPEERLSRMTCTVKGFTEGATHFAAEESVLQTLRERYGPPSVTSSPSSDPNLGEVHQATWRWRDEGAELVLESRFVQYSLLGAGMMPAQSSIVLTNTGQEHLAVVEEAGRIERERQRQRQLERTREEQRRRQEQIEALEGNSEALGKDL